MKGILLGVVMTALIAGSLALFAYRGGFGRGPAADMAALRSAPLASPASIPDGGDILAVALEEVTRFEFNLPQRRLTAQRAHLTSPFSIEIVNDKSERVERCVGGRGFAEALAAFASIRGMRTMDPITSSELFEAHKDSVADFVLAGGTAIEPQPYRVLVVPGRPTRVLVTDTLVFYDSMLPAELVQRLKTGCSVLGS